MKKTDFDSSGGVPTQIILLPEVVTSTQMDLLNRTIATLTNSLLALRANPLDDDSVSQKKRNAGGVEEALEASIIQLSNRIDTIVSDNQRWNLDFQQKLQAHSDEAHNVSMDFYRAQARAAEELTTPHFRYRPSFKRMEDGMWIAYLGSLESSNVHDLIIGLGKSPHEAVLAFDSQFNGQLPEHMLAWLAQVESAASAGVPPPKPPNTTVIQKQNETTPLDGNTNRDPKRTPRKRNKD